MAEENAAQKGEEQSAGTVTEDAVTKKTQDKLVRAEEFAARVDVGVPAIRKWVLEGKVPFVRLYGGRTIRFRESDINRIVETGSPTG